MSRDFFVKYPLQLEPLTGHYDLLVMSVSLVVAVFASFSALSLADRFLNLPEGSKKWSNPWLINSSAILGSGIWSMHFIAMLAFKLHTSVAHSYHLNLTLLSLLAAILGAYLGFLVLSRDQGNKAVLPVAGCILAIGVATMHYSGMEAMGMGNSLQYDPLLFALSIVVGVTASILSLWLLRRASQKGPNQEIWSKVFSSVLMATSIAGVHYTGMAAALFFPASPDIFLEAQGNAHLDAYSLASMVALFAYSLVSFGLMASFSFGTKVFRDLGLVLLTGFLIFSGVLSHFSLEHNKQQTLQSVQNSLETVLATTQESLTLWLGSQKRNITQLGHNEKLVHLTQELLKVPDNKSALLASEELANMRRFFQEYPDPEFSSVGFFIINRQMHSIGSARDSNLGSTNLIARVHPEILRQVFQGETIFISPIRSDVYLTSKQVSKTLPPTLFIVAPIKNFQGQVLAAVAKRMDPSKDFSQVIQLGRLGETGETYGFSQQGILLSESRFDDQLRRVGLIPPTEHSVLYIKVRNPGVNLTTGATTSVPREMQPLTYMAQQATSGISGANMQGYRDYRGVPVFGAWAWNDFLGIGLTTEIDVNEALAPYHTFRITLIGVLSLILLFSSFGVIFTLIFSERAYRILRLAQQDLEAQVNLRTQELRHSEQHLIEALKQAEAATKAKSSFLANMSHEIRTPMNAIIGFTDVLKESELGAEQRKQLETVNRSAKSLLTLLNDILDIAKLEEGKLSLETLAFNLTELIEDVVSTLSFKLMGSEVQLAVDYPSHLTACFLGDPTRLRQVLINLMGNATKFTAQGSITLKVTEGRQTDFLHFQVIDTGIGIPQDRLKSIFEPFSQADASTTRNYGGTGLGTTISRQLVDCMQGEIWVESCEGEGSTFHFTAHLPATECVQNAPTDESPISRGPSLNILIADDIPENIDLASFRLNRAGHHVFVATNGLEALAMAKDQGPFDLVLMDIQMPKMDGMEATRQIRSFEQQQNRPRLPIIALSASILKEDQIECETAGMDGFIGKPIDFRELFLEIEKFSPAEGREPWVDPSPPSASEPLEDIPGVDIANGLKTWQDPSRYHQNLQSFAKHHGDDGTALLTAFSQEKDDEVKRISHTLKGVAGNLSMPGLCEVATKLNGAPYPLVGPDRKLPELLNRALKEVLNSVAQLKSLDDSIPEPAVTVDIESRRKLLSALLQALDSDDPDQIEPALKELSPHLDPKDRSRLADHIEGFEFREAEKTTQKLLKQC